MPPGDRDPGGSDASNDNDATDDGDAEDADPQLARERTELAWTRSTISFAALGVAILKFRPVLGVLILVFSGVIWLCGRAPRHASGVASRRLVLLSAAVATLGVAALILTLLTHDAPGLGAY